MSTKAQDKIANTDRLRKWFEDNDKRLVIANVKIGEVKKMAKADGLEVKGVFRAALNAADCYYWTKRRRVRHATDLSSRQWHYVMGAIRENILVIERDFALPGHAANFLAHANYRLCSPQSVERAASLMGWMSNGKIERAKVAA